MDKNYKKDKVDNMISFVEKVRPKGNDVYLIQGTQAGLPVWRYLKVHEDKKVLFEYSMEQKSVDICHYGEIIYAGQGDTPPVEFQKLIEVKFAA